jgi:hypothetical protein
MGLPFVIAVGAASAVILGSESHGAHGHILLRFETPPTWRARSPYLYPPGTGWPEPRDNVVGWGTMLQAGRSPFRVPDEVDFFKWPNSSSRTMVLGSTQPLTEMSTKNLPGGKKRPAHRADNLVANCVPNVWKCGSLNLSQPYGPPQPVQG